jgi:hypothetical protein
MKGCTMAFISYDNMTSSLSFLVGEEMIEMQSPHFLIREANPPVYAYQATVERLDDIPLLMALQKRIGLGDVIDSVIPRHWLHQGLSIGQLVMVWNTFILSQGDHRKVTVRGWVAEHCIALEELLGFLIRDTDFTDDRLGQLLTAISDDEAWRKIESKLWQNSICVYSLHPQCVRLDATTANGYHTVTEEGLMQYGYNKENKNQPQVKLMAASADIGTNGHLVAIEVIEGLRADAPLYQPLLARMHQMLNCAKRLKLFLTAFLSVGYFPTPLPKKRPPIPSTSALDAVGRNGKSKLRPQCV